MKTVVLEKHVGKKTITRMFKNGCLVTKRNNKQESTEVLNLSDEALELIVQSFLKKGYCIVDAQNDRFGNPYVQEQLF